MLQAGVWASSAAASGAITSMPGEPQDVGPSGEYEPCPLNPRPLDSRHGCRLDRYQ
jgi:hypothetical protein